jgi:putative hydrolase of the HAD superfamily
MAVLAVTLDAAGTLIEVAEPVGDTYARLAVRHGIRTRAGDVGERFRRALADAPPLAFPGASPSRLVHHERDWWRTIVRAALGPGGDQPAFEACFDELFAHYAQPAAWRVFPDVVPALRRLRASGVRTAVVSNFDSRLPPLLGDLGVAEWIDVVLPSTTAGRAKPDPAIFAAALARLGTPARRAIHVGDDIAADVAGALRAGMAAVLIDRAERDPPRPPGVPRLASLCHLDPLLEARRASNRT